MTAVFANGTDEDEKALELLASRQIGWFSTIGRDGSPRAVPVWFWWEDGLVYVLTEPTTRKVAHVRRGSPVLFHLETGSTGDDVVIMHGSAEILPESTAQWLAPRRDGYEKKYADAIVAYGMSLDQIAEVYSTTIVFTPERAKSW